ncbi:MAG: excinuclease ABC subunit UvrA [Myxococcales bacterium]|nr:MAG: excinuclease ABC subunit UvrA [Myxococcales bacterium]
MPKLTKQAPPEPDAIVIRGAREHNLKNVTVRIPKHSLVVLTGVSGSGKSSLAFDTLYAEGQRRYVESLSSYARQFLGQMEKPKYDTIRGLSPTISIEQKTASSNPRSTVGTVTEVHDYLRVLYASIGVQHCPKCGVKAAGQSAEAIVRALMSWPKGETLTILAPLMRQRKGEHKDVLESAQSKGFARLRIDGRIVKLGQEQVTLDKKSKHDIDVVVDRVKIEPDARARITDSVETALREGEGKLVVLDAKEEETAFSEKCACPKCGMSFQELSPLAFSFNSPIGFCADCNGLGSRPEMDPELVVPNPELSIKDGAVQPWAAAVQRGEGWTASEIDYVVKLLKIKLTTPWKQLTTAQQKGVLWGTTAKGYEWEGLCNQLMRRMRATSSEDMKQWYMRYFSSKPCPTCHGARLKAESRAVKIAGMSLTDLAEKRIEDALRWVDSVELKGADQEIAVELRKEIRARLGFLLNVGLGYLTLDRAAATLSGGESQRIRLASQIGSELTGVVYILDEPSIGLHQRDNGRLLATLEALRDLGNSVVVVEHDEETMAKADYLIDFGPGAGELGGYVVAEGTPEQVMKVKDSLTGAYLSGRKKIELPAQRRAGNGKYIEVKGATEHNLRNLDVKFPLGALVAVTGVSGAGKSTLVNGILYPALSRKLHDARMQMGAHKSLLGTEHVDKVIAIDQKPIGRTPRSNPATYTKVFDQIRDLYASTNEARAYGYDAGRFSFNVKGGRCEACSGDGVRQVEMHFLPDVYVTCEECRGRRFNDATLRVVYKNKSIADTLEMSVLEGLDVFSVHTQIMRGLQTLADVGLGYVKIGQPSPTLSGGEAQRIKLARELSRVGTGRTIYILDEPTTGLHFADVEKLLVVLQRLVDAGNTVVVIEHNLDVIAHADWVIDLGPEGGTGGGQIIAQGTPEEVARVAASHTGRYLKEKLDQLGGSVLQPTRASSPPSGRAKSRSGARMAKAG